MNPNVSPPSRAAWIEMRKRLGIIEPYKSPPSRAAWIEIVKFVFNNRKISCRRLHGRRGLKCTTPRVTLIDVNVAAFTGGVD